MQYPNPCLCPYRDRFYQGRPFDGFYRDKARAQGMRGLGAVTNMKSMPLRPTPDCWCAGAFPWPAQDLAATDEPDLDTVDQSTGRKLLLIGGAVSAVGGLLQMQVKVKDKDEKRSRKLSKVAMLAGLGAMTWAMFDTASREYLQSHLAIAAPPPSTDGLGGYLGSVDDPGTVSSLEEEAQKRRELEELKNQRIRQRMILAGIGLGPMAEPIHIQKAIKDLDPKMGEMLTAEQTRRLDAEGARALETQKTPFTTGSPPQAQGPDLSTVKKIGMVPVVVGGAAIIGTLLLANR